MAVEDITPIAPLLGEALSRLRSGAVIRQAGYDGESGIIRLFEDRETRLLYQGRAPVNRV